ncbi:MAG: septum formation initiator family protein [Candidatus Omnitrophica bacterium]|nr:septum formation initiator family protein [Candidatus Omnitrophota bacterium]
MRYKRIFFYLFLLLILGWIYTPGFLKLRKYALLLHQDEREIEELKRKNKELKKEIHLLENDPFIIEKLGREELGLAKEGEIVYKIR